MGVFKAAYAAGYQELASIANAENFKAAYAAGYNELITANPYPSRPAPRLLKNTLYFAPENKPINIKDLSLQEK